MRDDEDFDWVRAKLPKRDSAGNDATGLRMGPGGYRRPDGTLANQVYDLEHIDSPKREPDSRWDGYAVPGQSISSKSSAVHSEPEDLTLSTAVAGLALIGLTAAAVGAVGASRRRKTNRREIEWERAEKRRADALGISASRTTSAPPGWYDAEDGRQRWWDGQQWTQHFQIDPRRSAASAGWYDDGSGRSRWWDGQEWTGHFQEGGARVAPSRRVAGPASAPVSTSHDVVHSPEQPTVTMTSAEWQERVRAMLLARAFSEQQWNLLSRARIEDADQTLLEWQGELSKLTAQQFSERINYAIESSTGSVKANPHAPSPGWYDDGSGRDRWWDGGQWTDLYRPEKLAALAAPEVHVPAGWYDDVSGQQRWWTGQNWA